MLCGEGVGVIWGGPGGSAWNVVKGEFQARAGECGGS